MPLAEKLAWKKHKTTPRHIQIDDLKSAAYSGLVDAASKFNPAKNACFASYAAWRITGEIQDYLRELSWAKRKVVSAVSLDNGDTPYVNFFAAKENRSEAITDFFEEATKSLNDVAKQIVSFYYVDGLSLKEIGQKIGVGESRVSQLLTHSKRLLKDAWNRPEVLQEAAA